MAAIRSAPLIVLALAGLLSLAREAWGSAFVRGAYYRLGDDDASALAGTIGNDPTVDSFGDMLHLDRSGSPRYSSAIPPQGPFPNKLSMAFANEGLGGPAFPGVYGRSASLSMVEQGYALEAWVNAGPTNLEAIRTSLVAYNGDPAGNGFGFFLQGENYVARVGTFERVLGPAAVGQWHHLAYVQSLGTVGYYYDGKLVAETTTDPLPLAATGGFWLGGMGNPLTNGTFLFNGWIDEVRYQTFNPLAAGSFNPTAFLITPVPEPSTVALAAIAGLVTALLARRRWRSVK